MFKKSFVALACVTGSFNVYANPRMTCVTDYETKDQSFNGGAYAESEIHLVSDPKVNNGMPSMVLRAEDENLSLTGDLHEGVAENASNYMALKVRLKKSGLVLSTESTWGRPKGDYVGQEALLFVDEFWANLSQFKDSHGRPGPAWAPVSLMIQCFAQ